MVNKIFVATVICGIMIYYVVDNTEINSKEVVWVVDFIDTYLIKLTFGFFSHNIPSLRDYMGLKKRIQDKLFTVGELEKFDGESGSQGLYLSVIGKVYDVEKGKKHYGPGGSYHYFAGRDASKAFITGDFSGSDAADDLLSLQPEELIGIDQWTSLYDSQYVYKGKLIGRYYDSNGNPTEYHKRLRRLLEEAEEKKRKSEDVEQTYPPCNSEWNRENGTKVWCTKLSGGIKRSWIGVPRMLYSPGSDSYRCACIEKPEDASIKRNIREYPGCQPQSASCRVYT